MVQLIYKLDREEDRVKFYQLTKNAKICVLCFSATWCGPCKKLGAELGIKMADILESEHDPNDFESLNDSVVVVKVDIDVFEDLAKLYDVNGIPHVVFFHYGKLQNDFVIGCKSDQIVNKVRELIHM